MGNLSKKAKAKVDVTLENTIILQGETLNGKISILPKQNSDITKLQNPKINIAILQEQNWQSFIFSQEEKTTKNDVYNNTFHSNQTLNCSQYKDKNFSEGIIIPFQYKVPNDITPTLEWPSTIYEFAYIRNFLIVDIAELSFKTKILLIILKKPCPLQSPLKISIVEERKKLLLFGSGKILIEGSYPKSSFPILGNIPITVKVDASKSDVLIKSVTVKLKRKLEFFLKNSLKSKRSILQNMYQENKKVCSKCEDLLFNIPFKDSNEITYNLKSSPLGENTEMCCLIPNVSTNTIKVIYYIKIIAEPDDLLAKKMELKMMVDFYSKDEDQLNRTVYDNFDNQVKKINSGEVNINYTEPYLNYQNNNPNCFPRNSQSVYNHSHTIKMQNEFNFPPNINQNYNYNYNQMPINYIPPSPNYPVYQNNNNNYSDYQNMNMNNNMNQINNNYPNYQNMNDNLNINNIEKEQNHQNEMRLPEPPGENLDEELDLPTLDEIKQQKQYNDEKEKNLVNNNYPEL